MTSGLTALVAAPVLIRAPQCAAADPVQELGRLQTRHSPATEPTKPGTYPLGLRRDRDGVLYLPPQYAHGTPIPLVLLLHGAGGTGARVAQRFKPYADELGIAFVAPDSTAVSWDRNDRLASDVEFIDRALAVAFRRISTTPDRLRIGGFSDGASYSLSVGLTNGDLFARILALSASADARSLDEGLAVPEGIPSWMSPIVEIVPAQLYTYHLTVARGLNPESPRTITKVTETT